MVKIIKDSYIAKVNGREIPTSIVWDIPTQDSKTLTENLEFLILKHGLEIPKKVRFQKFINILNDKNSDDFLKVISALEVTLLITALQGIKDTEEWRELIEQAINYEAPIPDLLAASRGRDALFEIFLAGYFNQLDIIVKKGEPDLICERAGYKFTVAAKRIKSKKALLPRIKKAIQQISNQNLPGIIFIDLSAIQEHYGKGYKYVSPDDISEHTQKIFNVYYEKYLPEIKKLIHMKPLILGVFAHSMGGTLLMPGKRPMVSNFMRVYPNCQSYTFEDNFLRALTDDLDKNWPSIFGDKI